MIVMIFILCGNLNIFFLRLQAETGITLYEHESLIIFDEVQLFPKARQAIKHLVFDGRYSYLETGSLISIKKNVKDILIPSEEMRIQIYPMDYKGFCDATGGNYELLCEIYNCGTAIGQATNRKLMRDLRIYMAVGGMPQAVEAYVNGKKNNTKAEELLYELFYHTWEKNGSTHYYEVDFLISEGSKINAFEIKSSGTGKHESIKEFSKKFSQNWRILYDLQKEYF